MEPKIKAHMEMLEDEPFLCTEPMFWAAYGEPRALGQGSPGVRRGRECELQIFASVALVLCGVHAMRIAGGCEVTDRGGD